MTTLFGNKVGSPKAHSVLLNEVLSARFHSEGGRGRPPSQWYVATDDEKSECLVLVSTEALQGISDPYVLDFEVLLYIARSNRQPTIAHHLASSTKFRFLEPNVQIEAAIMEHLAASSTTTSLAASPTTSLAADPITGLAAS